MRIRAITRPSRTALGGALRLLLCAPAAFGALLLIWIGTGDDWLHLPHWQAALAAAGGLIAAAVALWQFVLALHSPGIGRVFRTAAALVGILVAVLVLLYTTGGYMGALVVIGIAWLEIIRRTWPRGAFRAPRVRAEALEPPTRGRAG